MKSNKSLVFLLVFFVSITQLYAAPTINIATINSTCEANGRITVTATNTTGIVKYALISPSVQTRPAQESNIFDNLPKGSYTVAVYDASTGSVPVTKIANISSSYTPLVLSSFAGGGSYVDYCGYNGYVNASTNYGRGPFKFELTGTVNLDTISNSGSFSFTNLPDGLYNIKVADACGRWVASYAPVTVTNHNNTLTKPLTISFDSTGQPYNWSCNSLNFYLGNLSISDIDNKQYPYLDIRLEYPLGTYSEWMIASSSEDYLYTTLDINAPTQDYRFQVLNPCDSSITSSDLYTMVITSPSFSISAPGFIHNNLCDYPTEAYIRINVSGVGVIGTCPPYTMTAVPSGGGATINETITSQSYMYIRGFVPGTSYTITIKDKNGTLLQTLSHTAKTPLASDLPKATSIQREKNCDFSTMKLWSNGVSSTSTGFPNNFTGDVIYSIVSGPATRPSITLNGTQKNLWQDLPFGSYVISSNVCGRITNITVNNPKVIYGLYVSPITWEYTNSVVSIIYILKLGTMEQEG